MHRDLLEALFQKSAKSAAQLIRADRPMGWSTGRERVITSDSNREQPGAPNLLARQSDITGVALPRIWIDDFTDLPMRDGFFSPPCSI